MKKFLARTIVVFWLATVCALAAFAFYASVEIRIVFGLCALPIAFVWALENLDD